MFYDIFAQLMKKNNVSTYRLTKDTGISNGLISNWRQGVKIPSGENLIKIADYFNVSVDYLLGRSDTDISVRNGEPTGVDEKTRQMTELFNSLDDKGQKAVINLMKSLLE